MDRRTDALPDQPTDQPTDTASHRGALSHLKMVEKRITTQLTFTPHFMGITRSLFWQHVWYENRH